MNAIEINNKIRLMILEERARYLKPTDFTDAQTEAINLLANLLVAASPETFEKKVSLQPKETNINRFQLPSDCLGLKAVWDLDTDAGTVTGAADNGSGAIRLTVTAHGFADEDVVTVHDVAGCTEANGTWQIDYVSANTFDLVGSTFSNAYTSGGKVFLEEADTYKYPIARTPSRFQEGAAETKYFMNEDDIVIDDPDFENDIIVLYRYLPSTLSEIPARMHFGIWAYATILLIHVPAPQVQTGGGMAYHPDYYTLQKNLELSKSMWETAQLMASSFRPVLVGNNISDRKEVKRWI